VALSKRLFSVFPTPGPDSCDYHFPFWAIIIFTWNLLR